MTLRCKPGDLAIVTGSVCKSHNGKIVEVLEFVAGGRDFVDPCGALYKGHPGDPPSWLVVSKGAPFDEYGPYWVLHDSRLRPIRPPAQDKYTETTKELEAV